MPTHLQRDLERLHRQLLSMCALVEEMVHRAVDGLAAPNEELANRLAEEDVAIDQLDIDLEEACLKILALHQPVAGDLRRITAVMKISNDLERVADLAVHIAERVGDVALQPPIRVSGLPKEMAGIAVNMLHRAIDAYVVLDSDTARAICASDDEVDKLNRAAIQELVGMMQRLPDQIEPILDMFSICRHVERVADHATHIAENVVYLDKGEVTRHRRKTPNRD